MQTCRTIMAGLSGLALWISPLPALAWGEEGHRASALVAEPLLTQSTRATLHRLLGAETLADAAVWMDRNRAELARRYPGSAAWHFDDLAVCGGKPADSCPEDNCASRQLPRWLATLADPDAADADRRLALRLTIHLLGDLHQPLHAADNGDRGGNELRVVLGLQVSRLHAVWDSTFVLAAKGKDGERAFAGRLLLQWHDRIADWQQGTPQDWIEESHRLATEQAYGRLPAFTCPTVTAGTQVTLDRAYRTMAVATVRQQLARAGARIAYVLNNALGGPTAR